MRRNALLALLLILPGIVGAQEREVIQMPGSLEGLPFSTAVRVGDLVYLSGQVGVLPGTQELAAGGIGPETRQTMENIKRVLDYVGSGLDRVVKCTVFLADVGDYEEMNEVYRSYFPTEPPARSTLGASGLALGAAVEIECIALTGTGR